MTHYKNHFLASCMIKSTAKDVMKSTERTGCSAFECLIAFHYHISPLIVCMYIYICTERDVVEAPFLRCFEKVTEKHLWSVYHQMLIVLICFNSVWDMFNYLAWVMKINQTKVMCHSIFVLI